MLRERIGEYCAEKEFGEQCTERAILGTLCRERDWVNTVLRMRLAEHCAEREVGGHCAEREIGENCAESEIGGTMC